VAPVTLWLAGPSSPATALVGLTVSSVLVAQGDPPRLAGLLSPATDLAEAVCSTGTRFVVHLLRPAHRRLAQHFAGQLPAPPEDLVAVASSHGPVLAQVADRLACTTTTWREFGWSVLVEAQIDDVTAGPGGPALAWYRGAFATVTPGPAPTG
jgi:flavin reductase (DIM6/NTAB) family NADH-FMN oxidoreductase RutF